MTTTRPLLEVCAADVESALAARAGGADRIELCAALEVGGVTPGPGLLRVACEGPLPVVVLARPRRGDFLYTRAELAALAADVDAAREAGAAGVALGVLRPDGTIDREACARLVERARPLSVTFHRAFDATRDLGEALDVLVELGVDRVLTAGGAPCVDEGLAQLRHLVRAAGDRIVVLPGGGITPQNAARVLAESGARELHLSGSARRPSGMRFHRPELRLSSGPPPREDELVGTDAERVRAVRRALDG